MILVRVFRNAKYTFWSKFYHFIHVVGNRFMKCMLGIPSKSTSMDDDDDDDDDQPRKVNKSFFMEVGFFRLSWASLYIFTCQPLLWRGSSLISKGLDWTSPWTQKDVLKKRNPKIWIHPTQTHSWKSMVLNCCPDCFFSTKAVPPFRLEGSEIKFLLVQGWRGALQIFTFFNSFKMPGSPRIFPSTMFFSGGKDPLKWQIDTGEGFLRDAPDDAMGDMMGSGMALAKASVFWRGTRKNVVDEMWP